MFHNESEKPTIKGTATAFEIKSRATVREWLKNQEAIQDPTLRVNSRKMITAEGKRKPQFTEAEERVHKWYSDHKLESKKVEGSTIREEMLKNVQTNHPDVIILLF